MGWLVIFLFALGALWLPLFTEYRKREIQHRARRAQKESQWKYPELFIFS